MLRMMGCANGRAARHLLHSDCVVDEKTVVLQKKENEGFGFVLRGAKGRSVHVCVLQSALFSVKAAVTAARAHFGAGFVGVFCSYERINNPEVDDQDKRAPLTRTSQLQLHVFDV